jgi:tetratricopeptide (TPR) repeat protein
VLQLDEREEQASDKDLLAAATFLWHVAQLKRAGQIVQKIMEISPGNLNALALKGWIYLSAQKEDLQQKALGYFEAVLNEEEGGNHKHLSALLGQAKVYEKQKKYDECIEIISEITVCFPNFVQAVIEKAKIHIYNGEWD